MTREEAIQMLTIMQKTELPYRAKAIDLAISALSAEPSDLIRQDTIKELGDWLEQMIQHGVPSHSAKRKALANAIALLSMDTHEIHTETHECVKETHDTDLISRADAIFTEEVREALMRLTMCAREECGMCKYKDDCNFDKQYEMATDNMHTILNAFKCVSAERVGEWEHWGSPFSDESEVIDTIVCSVCGARFIEPKDEPKGEYNYCPSCGAKMKGGAE